jgi:protein-disulfide isomerase
MRLVAKNSLVFLVGIGLVGCVTRGEIEEIKSNQKEILAKLDKIQKSGPAARPQRPRGPDPSKVYSFPVGESAAKGPKDAWITIIEVSDFQCPFCKRVNETLDEVKKTYGDDVRVVFKHNPLPFHKRALPAAMAAECAKDQGKFWEMHDILFDNGRALEDKDLESYATKVGLNIGTYTKCMESKKYEKSIREDQRIASALGARGTPAFFINGRFLSGAQPFDKFKAIIDEELAKAKGSGIAKKEYYAKAVVEKGDKKL